MYDSPSAPPSTRRTRVHALRCYSPVTFGMLMSISGIDRIAIRDARGYPRVYLDRRRIPIYNKKRERRGESRKGLLVGISLTLSARCYLQIMLPRTASVLSAIRALCASTWGFILLITRSPQAYNVRKIWPKNCELQRICVLKIARSARHERGSSRTRSHPRRVINSYEERNWCSASVRLFI